MPLLLICLLIFGGFAFGLRVALSEFKINEIPIEIEAAAQNEGFAGASDLEARLQKKIDSFSKKRIWEIDIERLQTTVMSDEWVRDVQVVRTFPNGIKISVVPKSAVLLLVSTQGKMFPVTDDAAVLSALTPGTLPNVPILRGDDMFKDRGTRVQAISFVSLLPKKGNLVSRNISEIGYTKKNGFTLTLINQSEVLLGHDQLPTKLARVSRVLDYLSAQQMNGRVIDASFSKKVLVRLRKGP